MPCMQIGIQQGINAYSTLHPHLGQQGWSTLALGILLDIDITIDVCKQTPVFCIIHAFMALPWPAQSAHHP